MTYTTVLSSRVGDIKGLLAAWNDWGKAHVLNESSAIGVAMSQTMLGGDRAGEVNASFQWESIDQAMVGVAALTESTQLAEMYQAHGVTPLRRSLVKVMAVRGTREGRYMSLAMFSGDPTDEATASDNADLMWDGLSGAANGYAINQIVAGGEFTGMYGVASWTDSLDGYMEAAQTTMTSSPIQQMMAGQNIKMGARSLSRIL